MLRFLTPLLLLVLLAAPLRAQSPLADPGVWVTLSTGRLVWAPQPAYFTESPDNLVSDLNVTAASRRWMARAGVQVSDYFPEGFPLPFPFGEPQREGAATYRTVYALGGPLAQSKWFMGGVAAGPAVTWGSRLRPVDTCGGASVCPAILIGERESYLDLGLAGSVQGFVRLGGRVWLGGETMAVVNPSSTHLATRVALRVDLLRPRR